jgi:hypothetical protein
MRSLVLGLLVAGRLTFAWAATDAQYEKTEGIDKALAANPPTMRPDSGLKGKSFEAARAFGQIGCKARFEFAIAKTGIYPYAFLGRVVKGAYVRINTSFDKQSARLVAPK